MAIDGQRAAVKVDPTIIVALANAVQMIITLQKTIDNIEYYIYTFNNTN